MPTIGWNEAAPADSDVASGGDDEIRSLKVAIADGLEPSVYWPGSGGGSAASAGVMKPGAARTHYAAASALSANANGTLMFASDTSRLYHVGAAGAIFLGSPFALEHVQNPGTNAHWVTQSGVGNNGSTITFAVTYGATPVAYASAYTTASVIGLVVVSALSDLGLQVSVYSTSTVAWPASAFSVNWWSLGTTSDG